MRTCNRFLLALGLALCVFQGPVLVLAETRTPETATAQTPASPESDPAVLVRTAAEQNREIARELRQIKRELALLNQQLDKPGVREIIAGVGFIFGLCGVAALVATRRRER